MSITNHTKSKGILILFIILITIILSNSIFATNPEIRGLHNSTMEKIYCNYNSQTHNCELDGGDYNITGQISPISDSNINLIINGDTNFNVSCVSRNSEDSDCYILEDNNAIDIVFSGFNSIVVDYNLNIDIKRGALIDTTVEFKNLKVIINDGLNIYIDKNACLGQDYNNGELYSFVPKSDIYFDKLQINSSGKLSTKIIKDYIGYKNDCNVYDSLVDLMANGEGNTTLDFELNDGLVLDKISFNDVDNNGEISLYCQTKVDGAIYTNNNCNFYFYNLAGHLPKTISNANNYGILFVSTCGPISLPDGLDYNICKFNYIRPDTNVIDLNNANTGVAEINKVDKFCVKGSIADQISEYLFTSDSNIESRPVIFGTINSAITSLPLGVSLNTSDSNSGLYNTKNINQKISQISQQENTFFKLFLPNNHSTDTNLLDSYLFRFKLTNNPTAGYPDIGLNYPFKIHK